MRPYDLDSCSTWKSEAPKHFWVQDEKLVSLFTKSLTEIAHCYNDTVDLWFPGVGNK
jgi:hypothetical protein